MENKEKDYARLIAAQNESARRLKIKGINNTAAITTYLNQFFSLILLFIY